MEIQELIQKHQVQIRLLNQIRHFEMLKSVAENTLELLPVEMRQTSKFYKSKIERYAGILEDLNKNYKTL